MPRFIVVFCDKTDGQILAKIKTAKTAEEAFMEHPWLTEIYTAKWLAINIEEDTLEAMQNNIHNILNWSGVCMNLDDEILKDLNGIATEVL